MTNYGSFQGEDLPVAVGSVRGYRQWRLNWGAGHGRPDGVLTGASGGVWLTAKHSENMHLRQPVAFNAIGDYAYLMPDQSGVYTARCRFKDIHGNTHAVPGTDNYEMKCSSWDIISGMYSSTKLRSCGCGFWAYWNSDPEHFRFFTEDAQCKHIITGAIDGSGSTVIGTKGFRCEKAKIRALTVCCSQARRVLNEYWGHLPLYSSRWDMAADFPPDRIYGEFREPQEELELLTDFSVTMKAKLTEEQAQNLMQYFGGSPHDSSE